jgi:hypothetical protein
MAEVMVPESSWSQVYLLSLLSDASCSRWEYLSRLQECLPLLLDAYSDFCGRADLGPDDKPSSEAAESQNEKSS